MLVRPLLTQVHVQEVWSDAQKHGGLVGWHLTPAGDGQKWSPLRSATILPRRTREHHTLPPLRRAKAANKTVHGSVAFHMLRSRCRDSLALQATWRRHEVGAGEPEAA